jgi:hypothetical protein
MFGRAAYCRAAGLMRAAIACLPVRGRVARTTRLGPAHSSAKIEGISSHDRVIIGECGVQSPVKSVTQRNAGRIYASTPNAACAYTGRPSEWLHMFDSHAECAAHNRVTGLASV